MGRDSLEMGAGHSRSKRGCVPVPAKAGKFQPGSTNTTGYFLLSFKGEKIKVVNADSSELTLLGLIIKRHSKIVKEGWDQNMSYTFRVLSYGHQNSIQMIADTLLTLYQNGWHPMAPVDLGSSKRVRTRHALQATVMFKKKEDTSSSRYSVLSSTGSSKDFGESCLCLETYGSNYLGFHEVSNTVLHELVTSIQKDHKAGVSGVSVSVASVISDYTKDMPPVLQTSPSMVREKYIQIGGHPWIAEDSDTCENLQMLIIACLTTHGYKLSLDINMNLNSRVFFFIKDSDNNSDEVLVPDMSRMEIGWETRPVIIRSKSSFFRNYHRRKNCAKPNIRKRSVGEEVRASSVMSYKPRISELAWWQQASTDMSSEQEEE